MDPAILSPGEKLGEQQQQCVLWGGRYRGWAEVKRGVKGLVAALNWPTGQSRKTTTFILEDLDSYSAAVDSLRGCPVFLSLFHLLKRIVGWFSKVLLALNF